MLYFPITNSKGALMSRYTLILISLLGLLLLGGCSDSVTGPNSNSFDTASFAPYIIEMFSIWKQDRVYLIVRIYFLPSHRQSDNLEDRVHFNLLGEQIILWCWHPSYLYLSFRENIIPPQAHRYSPLSKYPLRRSADPDPPFDVPACC